MCTSQDVIIIIPMVVSISQRERCTERNTVTHEIVKCQFRRETVKCLFDDSTILAVVTSRDAEVCLFTTTLNCHVVILAPSCLLNGFHPVSVIVPVFKLCPRTVVVNLIDIRGSSCTLRRIVIHLLKHHCVVITIQQIVTFGLPVGLYTQRIVHASLTTRTTLGNNGDYTIGTT